MRRRPDVHSVHGMLQELEPQGPRNSHDARRFAPFSSCILHPARFSCVPWMTRTSLLLLLLRLHRVFMGQKKAAVAAATAATPRRGRGLAFAPNTKASTPRPRSRGRATTGRALRQTRAFTMSHRLLRATNATPRRQLLRAALRVAVAPAAAPAAPAPAKPRLRPAATATTKTMTTAKMRIPAALARRLNRTRSWRCSARFSRCTRQPTRTGCCAHRPPPRPFSATLSASQAAAAVAATAAAAAAAAKLPLLLRSPVTCLRRWRCGCCARRRARCCMRWRAQWARRARKACRATRCCRRRTQVSPALSSLPSRAVYPFFARLFFARLL
jgi:hypothetical protein